MSTHRRSLLKNAGLIAASLPFVPQAWAQTLGYPRTLQGPMVGAPTPTSLRVWVRTSGTFPVVLEVATRRDFGDVRASAPVESNAGNDFCVAPVVEGLNPATSYFYRFKFEGVLDRYQPLPYRTKTAPRGRAAFRAAFGSCARLQIDTDQRIFSVAQALEPDLMFFLGDNIYADSVEPAALADLYRRQREIERLKPFIRATPSLAIWDDHDFALNDSDRTNPIREQALGLFKNYWANPSHGLPTTPGIFFKYEYGGVDFFFLDGRYYRHSTDYQGADKSMLGPEQKAWLKDQLRASRAPFKVLVSGGGFSKAEANGDSWAVYQTERNELFDFIRDNRIEGVFGISGDSHMGELNCVPRSEEGAYDIYDLCSSPLANMPDSDFVDQMPEVRIRNVYTRSCNIGLMSFTFENGAPRMSYTLHNTIGASVWDPLELTPADLRNGVQTWRTKIARRELERLERYRSGGAYYDPGVN